MALAYQHGLGAHPDGSIAPGRVSIGDGGSSDDPMTLPSRCDLEPPMVVSDNEVSHFFLPGRALGLVLVLGHVAEPEAIALPPELPRRRLPRALRRRRR